MEPDSSYLYTFYLPLREFPKMERKVRQEAKMTNSLRDKVKHGK